MNTPTDLTEFLAILDALEDKQLHHKFESIFPDTGPYRRELYPKHIAFLNSTADNYESVFMAGNRTGKTLTAAYLVAMITTGIYPDWYKGKRWARGVKVLCVGQSSASVRDVIQEELLGKPGDWGTGLIPKDIVEKSKISPKANVPNAVDMLILPHISGDKSTIYFTSYDQDFKRIRGTKFDLIWLDEECPLNYYAECLIRTMTSKGRVIITFTPDEGLTDTVLTFLKDGQIVQGTENKRYLTHVDWDDVPHLTQEMKDLMWSKLPHHLRQAKKSGIPAVGAGAVYPFAECDILIDPFEIPPHWPRSYGLDVGYNDMAVNWIAWDREADIAYVYAENKVHKISPREHCSMIKDKGAWIPGVCDPSAAQLARNEKGTYLELYRREGLNVQFADNSVEPGIMDVYMGFQYGRLKIFSTCRQLINEFRLYRRDEHGKVVRDQDDHILDSLRYNYRTGRYVAQTYYETEDEGGAELPLTKNKYTGY